MNHRREQLISQIKTAYSLMADHESREDFVNASDIQISSEKYYEKQLEEAIADIEAGKYDHVGPEFNLAEHLANQKGKVQRIHDSIIGTQNNMEVADELISETSNKRLRNELEEKNERRSEALDNFKKDIIEAQAEEEL